MTDRTSDDATNEALDPMVERAAKLLRQQEPVRRDWRDALLSKVSSPPRRRRSTMRLWLPAAIAAVLGVAVGIKQLSARRRDAGDIVRFSVAAPSAKQVSLVGDFNRWNPSTEPMRRGSSDVWVVDVRLQPGRHVFAFSIDGAVRADSTAPRAVEDDFGVPGSVIVVPETGKGSH